MWHFTGLNYLLIVFPGITIGFKSFKMIDRREIYFPVFGHFLTNSYHSATVIVTNLGVKEGEPTVPCAVWCIPACRPRTASMASKALWCDTAACSSVQQRSACSIRQQRCSARSVCAERGGGGVKLDEGVDGWGKGRGGRGDVASRCNVCHLSSQFNKQRSTWVRSNANTLQAWLNSQRFQQNHPPQHWTVYCCSRCLFFWIKIYVDSRSKHSWLGNEPLMCNKDEAIGY